LKLLMKFNYISMKYPTQAARSAHPVNGLLRGLYAGAMALFLFVFSISCEGPQGPPGLDGIDGVNILGSVFEVQGTFNAANEYSIFVEFPGNLEVFETDVVLVYLLWDTTEDGNGQSVDIWRLLPQTRIIDQGLLQYNFDHTFFDVSIFLETNFDPSFLLPGDTDNQVFRIAVLPADQLAAGKVNLSDYEQVMDVIGAGEEDVVRLYTSEAPEVK